MRHVLVAVDNSAASERAAEFVNRFFGDLDVSITAVNVDRVALSWGPYAAAPGLMYTWPTVWTPASAAPPPGYSPTSDVATDTSQDPGEETIGSSGVEADEEIVEFGGDIAETLGQIASERGADLLVVGSNHKGVFERLISPSVSKDLAQSAPVPVLVAH